MTFTRDGNRSAIQRFTLVALFTAVAVSAAVGQGAPPKTGKVERI
jgi:hypothetical protein